MLIAQILQDKFTGKARRIIESGATDHRYRLDLMLYDRAAIDWSSHDIFGWCGSFDRRNDVFYTGG